MLCTISTISCRLDSCSHSDVTHATLSLSNQRLLFLFIGLHPASLMLALVLKGQLLRPAGGCAYACCQTELHMPLQACGPNSMLDVLVQRLQLCCVRCRYLANGTAMDYMYERLHIMYPFTFEVSLMPELVISQPVHLSSACDASSSASSSYCL